MSETGLSKPDEQRRIVLELIVCADDMTDRDAAVSEATVELRFGSHAEAVAALNNLRRAISATKDWFA